MDKLGNRSEGDNRKRRYVGRKGDRTNKPTQTKPRYQECRVLRPDERAMVDSFKPSPRVSKPDLFLCPICPRHGLPDDAAFWQHLRMKHQPVELIAAVRPWRANTDVLRAIPKSDALLETAEETMIRIVNSASHEEAIEIATVALCGG